VWSACTPKEPEPTKPDPKKEVPQGTLLWRTSFSESISATPIVTDDRVYTVTWNGEVAAIDRTNGKVLWTQTHSQGMLIRAPLLHNDTLYIASRDQNLYALQASDGSLKWTFASTYWNYASPVIDTTSTPPVLYHGSNDAFLYAINPETGKEIWRYKAASGIRSAATIGKDLVYIGDVQGVVHAVTKQGKQKWRFQISGHALESLKERVSPEKLKEIAQGWITSSSILHEGTLYFGVAHNLIGTLYALNASTGKAQWRTHTKGQIETSPVIHQGIVYTGTNDHSLYAFSSKDGTKKWTFPTDNSITSQPMIDGDRMYLTSTDGKLYVISHLTSELIWSFDAGDAIQSDPVYKNGVVYFGCMDGSVYAIKEPN
jgi:outer membrane protein assembly factor BamB